MRYDMLNKLEKIITYVNSCERYLEKTEDILEASNAFEYIKIDLEDFIQEFIEE